MSRSETTRESLRERVGASSKDAVVLEEMQRMGFWPVGEGQPTAAESLIRREAELTQELHKLGQELNLYRDPEQALKVMRKERLAAARARREETRRRHAEQRHARALAWHHLRDAEIGYLGEGVSGGLSATQSRHERLAANNLPCFDRASELAEAMGISVRELRFLTFRREVSRLTHYRRFQLPKKTGGQRLISAPMPRLKRAQYWVLDQILSKVALHDAAHGFRPGRSIVTNAQPHVGQAVVLNLDLRDFFPSIGHARVKGVFAGLGYSEQVATVLALLCTETPTDEVQVDGQRYYVAAGPRCLPQGAPSSPQLTNLLCRRLDRRLQGAAIKLGFHYTRYADDLTFSGDGEARAKLGKLLWRVKAIVADEGFTLHPDKQRVMRDSQRQEVTGIVVNERPTVSRAKLKALRATLHHIERDGPQGKHWQGNPDVLPAIAGYARFVAMVDPGKGQPLVHRIAALQARWGATATAASATAAARMPHAAFRRLAAAGQPPASPWWTPAPRPEPVREQTAQERKEERAAAKAAEAADLAPTAAPRSTGTAFGPSAQAPHREPTDGEKLRAHFRAMVPLLVGFAAVMALIWLTLKR